MKKILLILLLLSTSIFANYIVINNPVYTNMYSVKNKISEIGIVHLTWKVVKAKMKRANKFHQNKVIDSSIQATNKDYAHSGFDRGHFSANNADWDINSTDMAYTFSFTNITPQYKVTNRRSYLRVENYGRYLTYKYKSVFVINIAVPGTKYMKGHIDIPSEYIKIFLFNNIKECYRIPNDNKSYKLKDMKIKCNKIEIKGL